ncbi:MAG: hypothetical protein ACW99F_02355 [Candidatus Hodarchaeales archaeon]
MTEFVLTFKNRCFDSVRAFLDSIKSLKKVFFLFLLLHILIGAVIPPIFTSDFERNLFYGRAFWKHGFTIYDMTPLDIDPNYSIGDPTSDPPLLSYPNTTYDYPTVQLLFWAGMSILPFPKITAKWILSVFDILNSFLIYSLVKKFSSDKESGYDKPNFDNFFILSYILFSIPFSAIEGQSTSITIFFLCLPLVLYSHAPYLGYGLIGVGFHWKYVSLLILPYFILNDIRSRQKLLYGILIMISTVLILSFPILFSNFIFGYFGFFGNLGEYSGQLSSNPLTLNKIYISSILSTILLMFSYYYWLNPQIADKKPKIKMAGIINRGYWVPLLLLLSFLKIYSTAFPWYWMWFYPLITLLPVKHRRHFTLAFAVIFGFGLVDFVSITVGWEVFLGYFV